jgi:hypothetical protein
MDMTPDQYKRFMLEMFMTMGAKDPIPKQTKPKDSKRSK